MKKPLIALISLLAAASGSAAELTPSQALSRLQTNSAARKIINRQTMGIPQLIATLPELYVFSTGPGYMVLPADDIALPILAYVDFGKFCPEEIPALKWWLSTYSEQIATAAAAGISPQADTSADEREPIEPLLKTTWDQGTPYNDLAPTLYGRKCDTGCVATAMAQVMKYYNYPSQGQGSITYPWTTNGNQQLSMDFSEVTFDWDNMDNTYNSATTEEQNLAVATLMKACGYSVRMDYSTSGSGANAVRIGGALIEYFNYDQGIRQERRDFYEFDQWEDLIYADLAAGRPVIYGGQSEAGGHQFVCDGYSADGFFHFNWGWGGLSDGYFRLNALNPAVQGTGGFEGGYNLNQNATLGVQPPVEGSKPAYMLSSSDDFRPSNETVQLGGYAIFNCMVSNIGALPIPAQTQIDIELTPTDAGEPVYITCATTPEIKPTVGYPSINALLPRTLADGTYAARLVFKVPGGEWQPVLFPLSNNSLLTITVADSKAVFTAENEPGFTIADLPEDRTIYIGTKFSLPMTLTNKTATEYIGSMFPRIIKSDSDDLVGWGSSVGVELTGNETTEFEYTGTLSAAANTTLEPGSYRLYFYSQQSNRAICDPVPVTLAARPVRTSIEVTDFKFDGILPGDIAKFSWTVSCTEGYYDDEMTLFLLDSGDRIKSEHNIAPYLNQGESKQFSVEIPMSNLDYGTYSGALYYDAKRQQQATFTYAEQTTEINELTPEAASGAIYDLQGRRVTTLQPGHIYIRSGKLLRP